LESNGFDLEMLKEISKKFNSWDAKQKFPGAQPVSFQEDHIYSLQRGEHVVCEKSDGQRYFLVETVNPDEMYIIDRKYKI
jgi:hypothetical protein